MALTIDLWKKPKNVTIIEGFPGFGLVGPITTEFLIEHMKTEQVGQFLYDDLPATVVIHQGKVVNPMAIHYSKKFNVLIFHTILNVKGFEWQIADALVKVSEELKAKEIVSIEGVNVVEKNATIVFGYGEPKFLALGAKEMKESIIMGVSAALLLRAKNTKCLFAQASSNLPDSKAAAEIIRFLDKYLGLGVDPAPLLKQAAEFEQKLKSIYQQAQQAGEEVEKKNLSYLG